MLTSYDLSTALAEPRWLLDATTGDFLGVDAATGALTIYRTTPPAEALPANAAEETGGNLDAIASNTTGLVAKNLATAATQDGSANSLRTLVMLQAAQLAQLRAQTSGFVPFEMPLF